MDQPSPETPFKDRGNELDFPLVDRTYDTGLTLAAATGATTAELMHRAGHASAPAALRYQHASRDRDRHLSEALEEMIPESP